MTGICYPARGRDSIGCTIGNTMRNVLPRTGATAHFDAPMVLGDDAIGDRQPEPGAAADRLGRVERIEDALQCIGRMPQPLSPMLTQTSSPSLPIASVISAAVGDRLAGIDQQVHEHLVDLRQMAFDQRQPP